MYNSDATLCRGNGFITDYNIIKRYGLSDANYFFQLLLGKAYWNKVSWRKLADNSYIQVVTHCPHSQV
jgi:hypothetical protein